MHAKRETVLHISSARIVHSRLSILVDLVVLFLTQEVYGYYAGLKLVYWFSIPWWALFDVGGRLVASLRAGKKSLGFMCSTAVASCGLLWHKPLRKKGLNLA